MCLVSVCISILEECQEFSRILVQFIFCKFNGLLERRSNGIYWHHRRTFPTHFIAFARLSTLSELRTRVIVGRLCVYNLIKQIECYEWVTRHTRYNRMNFDWAEAHKKLNWELPNRVVHVCECEWPNCWWKTGEWRKLGRKSESEKSIFSCWNFCNLYFHCCTLAGHIGNF